VGPYRTAALIPSQIEASRTETEDDDNVFVPVVVRSESRALAREWDDRELVRELALALASVLALIGIWILSGLQQ